MSLNLQPTNPEINAVVQLTPPPAINDLVKSALDFVRWGGTEWSGGLNTWDGTQTHLIKVAAASTFTVSGMPVTTVEVKPGWNWVAFAHQTDLDLTDLDTVTHTGGWVNGDLLKSSRDFSRWDGMKFDGGLSELKAGEGLLLNCQNGGTLSFSDASSPHSSMGRRTRALAPSTGHATPTFEKAHGAPLVGASTAALIVTLQMNDAAHTSGSIGAFSEAGALLGVQTAHTNGKFYLSVSQPEDSATTHYPVRFKHMDKWGTVRELVLPGIHRYQFRADDVQELQMGFSSHRDEKTVSTPSSASTVTKVPSAVSFSKINASSPPAGSSPTTLGHVGLVGVTLAVMGGAIVVLAIMLIAAKMRSTSSVGAKDVVVEKAQPAP